MMKELDNKVALVTSSTRGIGRACAEALAAAGAMTYLAVRRPEAGREAARAIEERGGKADTVYFDADEPATYTEMVREVVAREGRIDILVNNFGSTDVKIDRELLQTDAADFLRIVERNLRTVYEPSKQAVAAMIATGGGSIVNISSVGGVLPDLSRTAYGVAKAAINFLTQTIAVQYAANGIRCNAVLPGLTLTDAARGNMSPQFLDAFVRNVPLGRAGTPDDIAQAVLFLASPRAAYITGLLLPVAGGFGLPTPLYAHYEEMKRRG